MTSESSSPRAGQAPRVPISLEGERRKAMKLVYAMERDCLHFRETWLMNVDDDRTDDWVEFVNLAKNRTSSTGSYAGYKDFEKDLVNLREDTGYLGSRVQTIAELQKVCNRAKAFENMFELSYLRIEDALNQYMSKYCLSFFAEIEGMDVESAREYENGINGWQIEIKCCLNDAAKAKLAIQQLFGKNFVDYVRLYAQVLHGMYSAFDAFMAVCDPFRSWVTADEGYVKRIRIELSCLEGQKSRATEILRKRSFKVHEQKSQELRTNFNNKKLGEEVQGTVHGRKYCRNREFSFVDKIEMAENVLQEQKLALEEAKNKVNTRPMHTLVREPTDGMKEKTSRLQTDVNRLEKQVEQMKRGKRDMRETRYNLQKKYHSLQVSYTLISIALNVNTTLSSTSTPHCPQRQLHIALNVNSTLSSTSTPHCPPPPPLHYHQHHPPHHPPSSSSPPPLLLLSPHSHFPLYCRRDVVKLSSFTSIINTTIISKIDKLTI